jgi:hypothetical protein
MNNEYEAHQKNQQMFMLNSLGPLLTAVRIEKINRHPVE